jgi:hypothetical protein
MSNKSTLIVAVAIAVLAFSSQAQSEASSCSGQIADLRQAALLNHQPTLETVRAQSYAQLMFAADLAVRSTQAQMHDQPQPPCDAVENNSAEYTYANHPGRSR